MHVSFQPLVTRYLHYLSNHCHASCEIVSFSEEYLNCTVESKFISSFVIKGFSYLTYACISGQLLVARDFHYLSNHFSTMSTIKY